MKKKLFNLFILLIPFIILSCGPRNISAPGNLHFGMIGGSYLFGTWDEVPGEESYDVFLYQSDESNRNNKYKLIKNVKNQNYIITYNSSLSGKKIIVQGHDSLGLSTTVLPEYGECKYDCVNNILSWTKCPINTQYLLVFTSSKSKIYDTISRDVSSDSECYILNDNSYKCQLPDNQYYAVYIKIDEKYYRMTKCYSTNDLKPHVRLSSYETGTNMSFNITWDKYDDATDYTVYIYSVAKSKWITVGNTNETSMTVKPKDFLELNNEDSLTYFMVSINSPSKKEYTFTIQIPLPAAAFSYYSKCKILDDNYPTLLLVMRTDYDRYNIYWNNDKTYYLSSYNDNNNSQIWSWMDNGVYSTGTRVSSSSNFEKKTFFLHTVKDWNYENMNRISNLVEVKPE